jgi:hypothetical protein
VKDEHSVRALLILGSYLSLWWERDVKDVLNIAESSQNGGSIIGPQTKEIADMAIQVGGAREGQSFVLKI